MDKRSLSERDICSKFITPKIVSAGRNLDAQIREEVSFTKGRIIVRGMLVSRGQAKRAGFLSSQDRACPVALMRNGSAAPRLTRRANAILLLDDGLSCEDVAKVLYLDDDTVRAWAKHYGRGGLKGLMRFESGGSASYLSHPPGRRAESLDCRDIAAFDAPSRRLYRAGIRRRL